MFTIKSHNIHNKKYHNVHDSTNKFVHDSTNKCKYLNTKVRSQYKHRIIYEAKPLL